MMMIIGPNGVGKTKYAYALARERNGEVINLDRTYLYRDFPTATGLRDALKEEGVARHLYGILAPHDPSPSADDFAALVKAAANDIRARGKFVIAEGASTVYVPDLLRRRLFNEVVGLRFAPGISVDAVYLKRIDAALADGLVAEIAAGLPQFADSFLLRECHAAEPIVRHLQGELTLEQSRQRILDRCLAYKDRQFALFGNVPEIQWWRVSA